MWPPASPTITKQAHMALGPVFVSTCHQFLWPWFIPVLAHHHPDPHLSAAEPSSSSFQSGASLMSCHINNTILVFKCSVKSQRKIERFRHREAKIKDVSR